MSAIRQGCEALSLTLTARQQARLQDYLRLMEKWNRVYNLTSVRKAEEMVSRHLMDSLAVLPWLQGDSLLDVGTGAGLPGVPIAIARPDIMVTLLDSNSKKTRFLQQLKAELGLTNIQIVHARVEEAELPLFSMVTARAFAKINAILALAGRHCEHGGLLLLMKGVYPQQELDSLESGFSLLDVISLTVPGCDGQRHLVRLKKE